MALSPLRTLFRRARRGARVYLEAIGIPADKITVSGIPIDPVFTEAKDKQEMRRKHGLQPNLTTILMSAGGFGVGAMDGLIRALQPMQHPAQVVAICGRNEELKKRIEKMRPPAGSQLEIKAIGYTTEMDEWMAAADIVLGKPGGLTTSEALAKGLVFVVVNPIPGQEERNSDHLLEAGAGIRCNNLPVLSWKLDQLLSDPKRFAAMQANACKLAHPHAAQEIVARLVSS